MSLAFSPIIIDGAFVLPPTKVGIIDASITLRPEIPLTLSYYQQHSFRHFPFYKFQQDDRQYQLSRIAFSISASLFISIGLKS